MNDDQRCLPWVLPLCAIVRIAVFIVTAGFLFQFLAPLGAGAVQPRAPGLQASASAVPVKTVIPIGQTVGIKLFSDGVMVVGLSEISTEQGSTSPAKSCGLRTGDIITHINQEKVDSIEEVQTLLQDLEGAKMSLRTLRGSQPLQVTAQAVQCSADGCYKLGAWIRDSMAGIGTMTFYDPETGVFGALGHGINDVDTSLLMPLLSGAIMPAEVIDVKKGASGAPGELHGAFQVERELGTLFSNTGSGVFGILSDTGITGGRSAVEIASGTEVTIGPATILSNISGTAVEEYEIQISRVYPASEDTRDLMIKVTDPRLLEMTGGIVQGMSGSPILQNGKLVGAVTHVLINSPTEGYGILAGHMLDMSATPSCARIA